MPLYLSLYLALIVVTLPTNSRLLILNILLLNNQNTPKSKQKILPLTVCLINMLCAVCGMGECDSELVEEWREEREREEKGEREVK